MSEEALTDDQSHYEVSLTAGQAFLAFVLLLLSLAASFAFGLMIGRGQGDDKMMASQNTPSIVDETAPSRKPETRVADLGAAAEDFEEPAPIEETRRPARTAAAPPATIREEPAAVEPPKDVARPASPAGAAVPFYAQLLSTSDQKKAETLAARLIDGGFNSAYVDRSSNERGQLFRVRVNFPSEQQARAAESKLKGFSSEVWITRQ